MGIYIKGMEMPKSCFYCPFREKVNPDDYVCMALNREFEETFALIVGKRHKDCPLIPVPKHGRLIDADALAEDLEFDIELDARTLDDMDLVGKERERTQFDKDCKQNCMWYLTEAPTIIPADLAEEGGT